MEGAIILIYWALGALSPQPLDPGAPKQQITSALPIQRTSPAVEQNKLAPGVEVAKDPRANLASLFSTDDYPREAIRNGEEGIVAVTLTVGPDGKVADCAVDQSSGSPSLDVQTCRILWSRAQFTPARDAQGKPVQDTYTQRIRWELPEGTPAELKEEYSRTILTVDGERSVVNCRNEASRPDKIPDSLCPAIIEEMRKLVSIAPDWIPFAGREIVFETQQRVGDPQVGAELGERAGEYQLGVARLILRIDAAGKVNDCSRESWGPMRSKDANFTCEFAQSWRFDELPEQETNRNDRRLTIVNAFYLRQPKATLPSN